ncbi:MAG TPA: RNA polymerase sigma-54 factor, partial [Caldimonas sp.]|nr:RNA polymerase sigma-54 factor [Caldimonas sp.]
MNFPSLRTAQRQQHTVTPRLQHAVRLLQLSSLDFAQEVHDAMGRNPFLEVEEAAHEAPLAEAPSGADIDLKSYGSELAADSPYERDSWQQTSSSVRTSNGDGDLGALDLVAANEGLRASLRMQINVLPLSPRDHALACAIAESLDDDGYLRTPLDELAATSGMTPAVDEEEMLIALKRV